MLDARTGYVRSFVQPISCHQRPPPSTRLLEANDDNSGDDPQMHQRNSSIEDLPGPEDTSEENIRSLFALFNNALAT